MSFSTYTSGLNALGILMDKSTNNLYIANKINNNIIKVDNLGNQSVFCSGFNFTENLVFDNIGFPNGYMYVLDALNTIWKVDSNGIKTAYYTPMTGHYYGFTIDSNNNLYYSCTDVGIYKIDTNGIQSKFINLSGIINYAFSVRIDNNDFFYVGDVDSNKISKFDSNGNLITANFISIPGEQFISDFIFDFYNNIYVSYGSDEEGQYINKYDSNGTLIASKVYKFPTIAPTSFTFDNVGNLYFTARNINDINDVYDIIKYNILSNGKTINNFNIPVQHISFNQKSSFCGTRPVSSTAIGIGAIRGKGSSTRIYNNCKGNNSSNFQVCQFRVLGYK